MLRNAVLLLEAVDAVSMDLVAAVLVCRVGSACHSSVRMYACADSKVLESVTHKGLSTNMEAVFAYRAEKTKSYA